MMTATAVVTTVASPFSTASWRGRRRREITRFRKKKKKKKNSKKLFL